MIKKILILSILLLFTACSVTTKISHNIVNKNFDYENLKSSKWEVYALKQIKTEAKGYAPKFIISKEELLNRFIISAERKLKDIEIETGIRPLPEALTGLYSKQNENELLRFVKETQADYLVFISDAGATHETRQVQMHKDTPGLIASSAHYELIINIWDVKNWKVVLSYGVLQEGSADLKKITDLAVDYIVKNGKIESD